MKLALGPFAGEMSGQLLCGKNADPNAPQPALMVLKDKRVVVVSETSNGAKFNESFMKLLTGGDTLSGRGLYQKDLVSFTPQCKLFLICNPTVSYL